MQRDNNRATLAGVCSGIAAFIIAACSLVATPLSDWVTTVVVAPPLEEAAKLGAILVFARLTKADYMKTAFAAGLVFALAENILYLETYPLEEWALGMVYLRFTVVPIMHAGCALLAVSGAVRQGGWRRWALIGAAVAVHALYNGMVA